MKKFFKICIYITLSVLSVMGIRLLCCDRLKIIPNVFLPHTPAFMMTLRESIASTARPTAVKVSRNVFPYILKRDFS